MNGAKDLSALFREGLKSAARQRRSDDLVDFMRSHWRLFSPTRQRMESLAEELEQRDDLSVDALSEALKVPVGVLFRKVKVVDAARTVLHPLTSEAWRIFSRQLQVRRKGPSDPELCLFLVAGEHSLVITNMRTETVPGLVHISVPDESGGPGTSIMQAEDVARRLPGLFGADAVAERHQS